MAMNNTIRRLDNSNKQDSFIPKRDFPIPAAIQSVAGICFS
jgi:hypothetical protein